MHPSMSAREVDKALERFKKERCFHFAQFSYQALQLHLSYGLSESYFIGRFLPEQS